jgi:hypothetical protein
MKKKVMGLSVAGLVLAIVAACNTSGGLLGESNKAAPRTSASYVLSQGQSVSLTPTAQLKLERINDSRCKAGAVCVWAGYISYSFVLNDAQGSSSFTLAEDMPGGSKTLTRNGLNFTLEGLDPPEPPALKAPTPQYKVSVRVNLVPPG